VGRTGPGDDRRLQDRPAAAGATAGRLCPADGRLSRRAGLSLSRPQDPLRAALDGRAVIGETRHS
jgi:hypothetical protein